MFGGMLEALGCVTKRRRNSHAQGACSPRRASNRHRAREDNVFHSSQ